MSSPIVLRINIKEIKKATVSDISQNYSKFARSFLSEMQEILLLLIKRNAPKKTGEYASSWTKGPVSTQTAQVETLLGKLFFILEFFGAQPGERVPVRVKALKFEGKTAIGTPATIFAKRVKWPGFAPIPHVMPSVNEAMQIAPDVIYANLGEAMPIFYQSTRASRSKVNSFKSSIAA